MRSTGLAKRLLDQTIAHAQTMPKVELIMLHVVSYNLRAIKFYKKHGFHMLDYLTQHYHIMGN
jgi:ribosomal protein S18 acetylase RimI-like enzyme